MILNSILCLVCTISLIGSGQIANKFLSTNYKSFSSLFLIGFIFQSLILQIIYIFFPVNFLSSLVYILVSIIAFFYFKNFSFIANLYNNKFLFFLFIVLFLILQSTSIEYPTNFSIPDFYLYHKNYIDWINNYPVVEGLALLNPRHGYAGITYINAAFYNFYPIFNNGWAILTPLFIIFFKILFFEVLTDKLNKKDKINLSEIFLLLSSYLVLKIILIINKGDVSHFIIFTIISLYIFYLITSIIENFNKDKSLLILLLILFLPTVLFSLSIYSFFVFLILVNQLISNKFFFDKIIIIKLSIYFFLIIAPMLYLNFIKSGYFLYPVTHFTNYINFNMPWSVDPNIGPEFIKGAGIYNWAKEKDLSIALITNWPPFYLSLILLPIITLIIFINKKLRKYIYIVLFNVTMLLIWYYSAPEQRYGTPYVWSLLLFEISILIFVSSFKIESVSKKLGLLFAILILLNLSQIIRYMDNVSLNYNYTTKDFKQHYEVIERDNIDFIVNDENKLLIYNGNNLFVTEFIDRFKIIKNDKEVKFRNIR